MLRNDLGLAHAQAGELLPAIEQFALASRLDPSLVSPRINLGLALEQKGDLDQAISQYAEAVRMEPAKAANHILLASALARACRTSEAGEHFNAALRIDPNNPEAREGLGQLGVQTRAKGPGKLREAPGRARLRIPLARSQRARLPRVAISAGSCRRAGGFRPKPELPAWHDRRGAHASPHRLW